MLRTVFEYSEAVPSPGGTYSVLVSSQTSGAGEGLSQAVVSHAGGGSGLVAFDSPRVPMNFVWRSEEELVVRFPDDLPSPRIDATNDTFGFGGRCRVVYEAVPRERMRPLLWTQEGELSVVAEEQLERGVLVTLQTGDGLEYSYSYYDTGEPDSSYDELDARGLQGGGESWAGIIHGLASLRAPELLGDIELDPEADGLAVRSTKRESLITVAQLVAAAKSDPELLDEAILRAERDGEME